MVHLSKVTNLFCHCRVVKIPAVKIVVFGSGGVGKTSLVRRYLYNSFQTKYQPTIEDDYRKIISYNGNLCDVTILDTTGTHQFPAMRRLAINNGDGFLVVYAIDDKMSLAEAKRLRDEIVEAKENQEVPVVLLGNKSDRSPIGNRKVNLNAGRSVVSEWDDGSVHMETSARLNHNVVNAFNKVLELIDMQPAYEEVADFDVVSQHRSVPGRKSFRKRALGAWRLATVCFPRSKTYQKKKQKKELHGR